MNWLPKQQLRSLLIALCIVLLILGTATAKPAGEGKDIVRVGSDLTIAEKQVVQDATAIAGSVIVLPDGYVKGDAVSLGGDVVLKSGARVDGDVNAIGGEIIRQPGSIVGGDKVTVFDGHRGMMRGMRRWGMGGILGGLYLFSSAMNGIVILAIAVLGILLMALAPHFLQAITTTVRHSPIKSGVWGLSSLIGLILLGILLGGSVLGIVVLPVVYLLALACMLLGIISMGLMIGEGLLHQRSSIPQFLIGMFMLGLVGFIPLIGGTLLLIISLFGFGGVLVSQWQTRRAKHLLGAVNPPEAEDMKRVDEQERV
jgi:hypothetical protein